VSDFRQPIASLSIRLAENRGKKTAKNCRIEIFPAKDFANAWDPKERLFHPRPPLRSIDRAKFWESRYRVRMNGQWLVLGAKYTLFTRAEILERFFDF
jgi:hypothetical protein